MEASMEIHRTHFHQLFQFAHRQDYMPMETTGHLLKQSSAGLSHEQNDRLSTQCHPCGYHKTWTLSVMKSWLEWGMENCPRAGAHSAVLLRRICSCGCGSKSCPSVPNDADADVLSVNASRYRHAPYRDVYPVHCKIDHVHEAYEVEGR